MGDLISDIVNDCHSPFIPLYIHKLFANICAKTKKIQINLDVMNLDREEADDGFFGFKKLKPLFFVDDKCVNYMKVCKIFNKELKQIVICNIAADEFDQSIDLDNIFLEQTLFAIGEISENVSLSSVFEEILIIDPFGSIDEFIKNNQALFVQKGWNLDKISHTYKKRLNALSDSVL